MKKTSVKLSDVLKFSFWGAKKLCRQHNKYSAMAIYRFAMESALTLY